MKSMIKELWHGNINPQEDSRNNSPEMKELMEYMARHHEDLEKSLIDGQKEIFEYAFKPEAKLTVEINTDDYNEQGQPEHLN